ncbi:MAG: ribokinase [Sphingobium sp.]
MSLPVHPHRSPPVFVIGSLVVACCARVPRCPEPGESLLATGFIMEPGGKGFNVALAAHRLGVPVDGVFAVGDDPPGAFMRAAFVAAGLDEALICTVAAATGAGVGLIQDDGDNRIAVYPGANAHLSAEHVLGRADRVRNAGLVFAQFEAPDAAIAEAFALARAAGVTTMLNPSPYRRVPDAILAATDIIVMNEPEAKALALDRLWIGDEDGLAASLAEAGVATLVITRGARGASAWHNGKRTNQPAFPVATIDSIGAGDAFAGGMIAALIQGNDIDQALRWGCAAGAIATTQLGLARALPAAAEIRQMLDNAWDFSG